MLEPKKAALAALKTHDALLRTQEREPAKDEEGLPLDDAEWVFWYEDDYKPAYLRWSRAMDDLQSCVSQVSRHPFSFRPRCEQILGKK